MLNGPEPQGNAQTHPRKCTGTGQATATKVGSYCQKLWIRCCRSGGVSSWVFNETPGRMPGERTRRPRLKMLETVPDGNVRSTLDELAREGAHRMLMEALDAEVADYVERHFSAGYRSRRAVWLAGG